MTAPVRDGTGASADTCPPRAGVASYAGRGPGWPACESPDPMRTRSYSTFGVWPTAGTWGSFHERPSTGSGAFAAVRALGTTASSWLSMAAQLPARVCWTPRVTSWNSLSIPVWADTSAGVSRCS
jgi:hypothetical protein